MEMLRKQFFALLSALVALTFLLTACGPKQEAAPEPTASATASISVTADPNREVVVDVAKQATAQQGFDPATLVADEAIDQDKAKSVDPGNGVFAPEHLTTPAAVAAFMASGTPQAKEAIAEAKAQTGATPAQLADPANWVAITTGEAVEWGGNTYYSGGAMVGASDAKVDKSGSVVMVFVPPAQVAAGTVTSVFFIRGACGNPQTVPPRPHVPGKPKCVKADHPQPGANYHWSQRLCKWFPNTEPTPTPTPTPSECVRTAEPANPPAGYAAWQGWYWERLSDCSWHWNVHPPQKCVKPAPPGPEQFYNYNPDSCTWHKKPQSFNCQQNGGSGCPPNNAVQPPQDNPTNQNTGTTPGAPAQPVTPIPGPSPVAESPAPNPAQGGYDSGASDGSGTPGGSLTNGGTTTGGGAVVPSTPPANTGQGGSNTTDPGGFN